MNSGDSGSFNHLKYDRCAYAVDLAQSVEPLQWMMYSGKFENCGKCTYNEKNFWRPFDKEVVDTESELKGISRRRTRCFQSEYSPNCKNTEKPCIGTFDANEPIVFAQEVCPIVHSGMPKIDGPGYTLNTEPFCKRR
jgi:hypothetical protein